VKYSENFSSFYTFFVDALTGHTAPQMFTRDGPHDAALPKNVTF